MVHTTHTPQAPSVAYQVLEPKPHVTAASSLVPQLPVQQKASPDISFVGANLDPAVLALIETDNEVREFLAEDETGSVSDSE